MNTVVPNFANYATLVFDCDGVVLDSNRVKANAFRAAALPWGAVPAEALVAYNAAHGGVSRYEKFNHFLDHIVPLYATVTDGPGHEELLQAYAGIAKNGLMACGCPTGLTTLRETTAHARWLIVSGGDQAELREIFIARGISGFFDGGIFGSPDKKEAILIRELENGNIVQPALFLGDSKYDHVAASAAGLDFLFVSDWSEFAGWPAYIKTHGLPVVPSLDWITRTAAGAAVLPDAPQC